MRALERYKVDSYWRSISAFDTINTFISMNYARLKEDMLAMLAGANKQKKKYWIKCDLGVSKECEPISEHSSRNDYWHILPVFLFSFSSVTSSNQELSISIFNIRFE